VVPRDHPPPGQSAGSVLIDVTSLIGAEDYVASENLGRRPLDPFARQCFVEVVQSLIFMADVRVAHPTLASPRAEDFGAQPRLLQSLISAGLLHPLRLDEPQSQAAQTAEADTIRNLTSAMGTRSVLQFVDQAIICDNLRPETRFSLSARLNAWAEFQASKVRVTGHHKDRISTNDGIESDAFGIWARSAAIVLDKALEPVAPPGEGKYLMATLARGLKYRARADAAGLCYQPHPMRRDFSLTFGLNRQGVANDAALDVIKAVRGIHESIAEAAGPVEPMRVRLLELEMPLLGGRLWKTAELGRLEPEAWIELVVNRIASYRAEATDLRNAIAACVTDEDHLYFARDMERVRNRLLDTLRLRQADPSPVERDLVESVASVVQSVTGIPVVSGLYFGVKGAGRGVARRLRGRPFEQFLYREFVRAWKRAGS
jgi:hypothetical protein